MHHEMLDWTAAFDQTGPGSFQMVQLLLRHQLWSLALLQSLTQYYNTQCVRSEQLSMYIKYLYKI